MSKVQRKRQHATAKGCYCWKSPDGTWDVFIESEWLLGPRGLSLTKREAVNLAYAIAVSKKPKLVVTYGDA